MLSVAKQQCWNEIGVRGDGSCPQLATVVHCRNCAVYIAAGRELLERAAPAGYVEEWTHLLAQETRTQSKSELVAQSPLPEILSLILFRIGEEWLALPVSAIKEATQPCTIHTLPHRTNHVFLGIVNIRGEILMCISLGDLLGLAPLDQFSLSTPHGYKRMLVLEIKDNRWVFPVDEIFGVHRFYSEDLQNIPVVVSKVPDTYTKKILTWQGQRINVLDSELIFYELLFYTLNRS